ncbi:hypothetical protein SISNIDRAFT_471851 [Sistotremastrum niveocremeum HHB9708]|uniref:Uncharacterized protein n=1 Tax=Sistotremastrum niveocremeum HHB9708 TaxID=1314777 RepID=A0A164M4U0_9AGAM|nr:hypothetical protein SISNIDRAFT_471851 [Sistotremastrum niveocremeum HHB9708]
MKRRFWHEETVCKSGIEQNDWVEIPDSLLRPSLALTTDWRQLQLVETLKFHSGPPGPAAGAAAGANGTGWTISDSIRILIRLTQAHPPSLAFGLPFLQNSILRPQALAEIDGILIRTSTPSTGRADINIPADAPATSSVAYLLSPHDQIRSLNLPIPDDGEKEKCV